MSKIERYQGNVQAFASSAQGIERTVFGETTQANDLTSQITAAFLRGWGIVGPSEHPSLEDFNGAMYALSQFIAYQHQAGIPEWHEAQEYYVGSVCTHNGVSYQSLEDSNTGNEPPSAQWATLLTSKNGSGRLLSVKAFTTSGPYTKTPGTSHVRVKVWGAGGGGANTSTSGQAAGGGCGGGYAEGYYDASEITTLTVTVGSGGAGVAAGITGTGGTGGASSFGSIISATGGTGSTPSSAGGVGSGGNIINFSANPSQGTLTPGIAGLGGASYSSSTAAPHTTIKGDDGSFPGGGGAGGNNAYASGKGAAGYIVVEEYS